MNQIKKILVHFLNSLLYEKRNVFTVENTKYQNGKDGENDIRIVRVDSSLNKGKSSKSMKGPEDKIVEIIEIRINNTGDIHERTVYSSLKLIAISIENDKEYTTLPTFVVINLLGYEMFHDNRAHRIKCFKDKETNKVYGYKDLINIHFIEYKKYENNKIKDINPWIKFLIHPNDIEFN